MSITIDVTKTSVADLPEKMLDYALEVLMDQAHLMAALWQIYINVDTGAARDSIRVERGGEGMGWRQVRVRGGGYIINPKTGRLVDYMPIIEAKYGAGQQAFDEIVPTIREMLQNGVVEKMGGTT
jgi:hypothetical protein